MMTQTKDPSNTEAGAADLAVETMALDTLTTALANVSAVTETFQSPIRATGHIDQIDSAVTARRLSPAAPIFPITSRPPAPT